MSKYEAYIERYHALAEEHQALYNIPASITLAQGLLESAAGESELAQKANNHFGIKCHDWKGRSVRYKGDCYRKYDRVADSYYDHSQFLLRPRYSELYELSITDYKGWAKGLKACGYATNPRYAQLLIDLIRRYNLDALDNERHYDEAALRRIASGVSINAVISGNDIASSSGAHIVRMNNRNYYVIARDGDTFRSIAKEFGVSYRKLAKYNERGKKDVLRNGEIVYLEKKRTKADKSFKRRPHIVRAGESMYSIAQAYGVRLKSLYKKNNMSPDHTIHVGDKIRVY
jgi:LysM repeat protein